MLSSICLSISLDLSSFCLSRSTLYGSMFLPLADQLRMALYLILIVIFLVLPEKFHTSSNKFQIYKCIYALFLMVISIDCCIMFDI